MAAHYPATADYEGAAHHACDADRPDAADSRAAADG